MTKENLISANEFCISHNIEISFIDSLNEEGLIEVTTVDDVEYICQDQLNDLEKIVRLYYDLDINIEGIETVIHLLKRINDLQDEITDLKNRLRLYESFDL